MGQKQEEDEREEKGRKKVRDGEKGETRRKAKEKKKRETKKKTINTRDRQQTRGRLANTFFLLFYISMKSCDTKDRFTFPFEPRPVL